MRLILITVSIASLLGCRSDPAPGSENSELDVVAGTPLCPDGDCVVVTGTVVAVSPVPEEPVVAQRDMLCTGVDSDLDRANRCNIDADGDGRPLPLDCDDADPARYPLADEILCDGIDQDCDGLDPCDRDKDGTLDRMDCEPGNPAITTECLGAAKPQPLD